MPGHLETILAPARLIRVYAEKLCVGIDPAKAARKPRFESGGKTIVVDTNHPSFVFGHLSIYPARAMTRMGLDTTPVAPPPGWEDLFKPGVECKDDPEGRIYPAWDTLRSFYFSANDKALSVLAGMDEKRLAEPITDPAVKERFPTLGAILGFYFGGHAMSHFGQVSAWRRCYGLPSAL